MTDASPTLRTTPLDAWHQAKGGRMVPFAGWSMPVQYADGILNEHRHCRAAAALFDVSHMGQLRLWSAPENDAAIALLERLVPADLAGLASGRAKLTVFTDANGGVLDDLIVTRIVGGLHLVVNAGRAEQDVQHLRNHLVPGVRMEVFTNRALLALQGPQAATVLGRFAPGIDRLPFMAMADAMIAGIPVWAARLGYTGEDGYELSCTSADAQALADRLCAEPEVKPAGLGARDSLRLEAGLNLYGHELSPEISPIEAGLAWTIGKRRRESGGFPGAEVIQRQLRDGPPRQRCGLLVEGRSIAREGTPVLDPAGAPLSTITSGTFSPTLERSIAMAYLPAASAKPGTPLMVDIRGRRTPAVVAELPFVPHRYARPSLTPARSV